MKILLTGGTGLVGKILIRQLATQHQIFCITHHSVVEDIPGVNMAKQDLSSRLDYATLPGRVDAVIHLAQSRRYREFPQGAEDVFSINTHATLQLAEYARQSHAQCFVYASTGGVYELSGSPIDETHPVKPSTFYSKSKYAAELLLSEYSSMFRVVVMRPFFIYGPGQKNMLIPGLVEKVLKSEPVIIEGGHGLRINPIHVEDAARAFLAALSKPVDGIFNVAGDEVVSLKELVRLMDEISGRTTQFSHMEIKNTGDLVAGNSRMKELLDVYPQISLKHGLPAMLNMAA